MNKRIFTVEELTRMGRKIARLAGNRTLKAKSVNSKMKSMSENGMLVPGIYVEATAALAQNLEVVDWLTGEAVTEENASEYIVLVDGQHRYEAHLRLLNEVPKEGEERYNRDFYLIPSLNQEAAISQQLLEINTVSSPWDGLDYARTALMWVDDPDKYPTLQAIAELTAQGCSLPAACEWTTFTTKVTKTVLVNLVSNENAKNVDVLKSSTGLDRFRKLYGAATSSFGSAFLQGRLLIDWICAKYRDTDDAKKGEFTEVMAKFLSGLDRKQIEPIEKMKGVRGGETKESLVNKELDRYYNNYLASLQSNH